MNTDFGVRGHVRALELGDASPHSEIIRYARLIRAESENSVVGPPSRRPFPPRSGRIIRCLFWRPWLPELAGGPSGIQQTSSLDCPSRVAAPGDGRTPGAFIRRSRQRFWLEEVLANIRSSVVRR